MRERDPQAEPDDKRSLEAAVDLGAIRALVEAATVMGGGSTLEGACEAAPVALRSMLNPDGAADAVIDADGTLRVERTHGLSERRKADGAYAPPTCTVITAT